jgi:tetratricopeptide (TPR) repeat protein
LLLLALSLQFPALDAWAKESSELNRARYEEAQKLANAGRQAQAEAVARLIIADDPEWMFGWLLMGIVLSTDETRLAQAEKALSKASRLDPNHVEPIKALGVLASKRGDRDAAIDYLLKASEMAEDDLNLQLGTARILATAQRFEEAKQRYQLVLASEPTSIPAVAGLAFVHTEAGEYSAAIDLFRKTITDGTSHPLLWVNLTDALIRSGRFEEALEASETGYARHPDIELKLGRVRALMGMERYQETVQFIAELRATPGQEKMHEGFLSYWLGMANALQGCAAADLGSCGRSQSACCEREAAALDAFRVAFEKDPQYRDVLLRLGLAQAANGLLEDAEATLENELRKQGDRASAELFGALAVSLYLFKQERDTEEAVRLFREARELAPDFGKRDRLQRFRQWPPFALDISDELRTLASQTQLAPSGPRTACACALHQQTEDTAPWALLSLVLGLLVWRRGRRP